ncbi:MAG: VIT1/CCC1 transporter family protein [Paracoccus sp. (in: a-proteobacteria)]|uniref:VIT1/CCC1 transporter family protein n=1 Tax=Paracoccus sp. TaxID=267 RepID=UPI0039E62BF0
MPTSFSPEVGQQADPEEQALNPDLPPSRPAWPSDLIPGANEGVILAGALIVGVAAAGATRGTILMAATAALVAGALAVGLRAYFPVAGRGDGERDDRARERAALCRLPEADLHELAAIYESRGMSPGTALQAAREVRARERPVPRAHGLAGFEAELGGSPMQAALAAATVFALAAFAPLLAAMAAPAGGVILCVLGTVVLTLCGLAGLGAWAAGVASRRATLRAMLGGALAMGISAALGRVFFGLL